MRMMLRALLARGARRENLQAKVYGGASTLARGGDIGGRNVDFAMEFLERERIGVYGGCVGGGVARRIEFIPGVASVTLRKSPELAANSSRPEVPIHVRGYAA
jgi:chemotaxis protein CheD